MKQKRLFLDPSWFKKPLLEDLIMLQLSLTFQPSDQHLLLITEERLVASIFPRGSGPTNEKEKKRKKTAVKQNALDPLRSVFEQSG